MAFADAAVVSDDVGREKKKRSVRSGWKLAYQPNFAHLRLCQTPANVIKQQVSDYIAPRRSAVIRLPRPTRHLLQLCAARSRRRGAGVLAVLLGNGGADVFWNHRCCSSESLPILLSRRLESEMTYRGGRNATPSSAPSHASYSSTRPFCLPVASPFWSISRDGSSGKHASTQASCVWASFA